jgi:hypothetical protein
MLLNTDLLHVININADGRCLVRQNMMRTSASITSTILKKHLITSIESIIDEGKQVSHSEVAANIESLILTRITDVSSKVRSISLSQSLSQSLSVFAVCTYLHNLLAL